MHIKNIFLGICFSTIIISQLSFQQALANQAKADPLSSTQVSTSQEVNSTKKSNSFPVKYISEIDQKIIVKSVTLAPVYDNTRSIYAAPIEKLLTDLLQADKVWGYSEFADKNKKIFVELYDSKPNDVLDVLKRSQAQGLLTAIITKGPHGLNARLKLFTQDQGLLLAEESFSDFETFEIAKVREEFVSLYHKLKNKLPYSGYIQSRKGLQVTINIGEKNGVKTGQEIAIAQILKINRHPKLKLMTGVEKEIIGKLLITKAEPYLSFAQIIFEKESGVVDVGGKTLPVDFISYPIPLLDKEGEVIGDQKKPTL